MYLEMVSTAINRMYYIVIHMGAIFLKSEHNSTVTKFQLQRMLHLSHLNSLIPICIIFQEQATFIAEKTVTSRHTHSDVTEANLRINRQAQRQTDRQTDR